jgi:hypothetical protein
MPPKASANGDGKGTKLYSTDVVAAVLSATGTTSLTKKNYELMSSLDGTKTASAFQHGFRAVLAKAKELRARIDKGEVFEPVAPATKRGTSSLFFCIFFFSSFTFTIVPLLQLALTRCVC